MEKKDKLTINTLRMLSIDMVEAANSGHPGLPLGAAPILYTLWSKFMRFNPMNPDWFNRDRFILSAGHGSALLYAALYLFGYDLPMEELKQFRQWGSKTPGHPEHSFTPGVEATTGPLGQGFAMGVGMALAEKYLAKQFNKGSNEIINHFTYGLISDGDLMEGITSEAASLAGHLKLGKLIYLYDDNKISIEGKTKITFTEDVLKRFSSYRWHTLEVDDGNDIDELSTAIKIAQGDHGRPSIIKIRTHIGYGSPKQDSEKAHGSPLGPDDMKKTKEFFKWPVDTTFYVPDELKDFTENFKVNGKKYEDDWNLKFDEYKTKFKDDAELFNQQIKNECSIDLDAILPEFKMENKGVASRSVSGKILNILAEHIPQLIGGSADLAPSNKTDFSKFPERNIRFGIREHAMGAIVNGMALHNGIIPFGATFLVFSDYMRHSIRLAALMKTRSIFIFTHDSIGVGEDGPTHQPIEHVMSLRLIPNLYVLRPADANETVEAWKIALRYQGPSALILTRQALPTMNLEKYPVKEGVAKGGYILSDCDGTPEVILIGAGSEVHLLIEAKEKLAADGMKVRVVSIPCWRLFDEQSDDYKEKVLPKTVTKRVAVEAGQTIGWEKFTGLNGIVIGIERFGESAPGSKVFKEFGFTVENIVRKVKQQFG